MYNNGDQMVSVLKFLFAKCCQYVYTGGVLYGKISDVLNKIPTLVVDSLLWHTIPSLAAHVDVKGRAARQHHSHILTNFTHFKTDYLL